MNIKLICKTCNKEKPLTTKHWHKNKFRKNGFSFYCKACTRKRSIKYFYKYKEILKRKWIQKTYSLSKHEIDTLPKNCNICGINQKETKHTLHIDHCHSTGFVRGVLCRNCNHGIGNFKDNISYLKSAIAYLDNAEKRLIIKSTKTL